MPQVYPTFFTHPVPGYVYFLCNLDGHIKIGKAINVEERLRALNVGAAADLRLAHSVVTDNYSLLEHIFQNFFCEKRIQREWFALSDADLSFVRRFTHVSFGEMNDRPAKTYESVLEWMDTNSPNLSILTDAPPPIVPPTSRSSRRIRQKPQVTEPKALILTAIPDWGALPEFISAMQIALLLGIDTTVARTRGNRGHYGEKYDYPIDDKTRTFYRTSEVEGAWRKDNPSLAVMLKKRCPASESERLREQVNALMGRLTALEQEVAALREELSRHAGE